MSNFVIVRVNDKLIPEFLIKFNSSQLIAQKSDISSWAEVKQDINEKLIVIISANLVLSKQVTIPSKNDEVIRQSIPFAIEEELASDIELNHFAYNKDSNNNIMVSVVNRQIIADITLEITEHDLTCHALYSEVFSCPRQVDMVSLCVFEKYIIVRDDTGGTAILPQLLNNYLKLSQNKQKVIFSQKEIKIKSSDNVITKVTDMALLQSQTVTASNAVNLLQGEYAQNHDNTKKVNTSKRLALLVFLLISSWIFINSFELWQLSSSINNLKESQKSLLIKLVPNAGESEVNDPYSAMLSRLKLNENSQSNDSKKGFIQALIYVGQTLQQHPVVEIISLRQRNSKLEVKLQASDVTSLNQFQQSLEKTAYSMQVKTGTRDSTNDGFSSIITMEQL